MTPESEAGMRWTSEKPTKPGWYWWRNGGDPEVCELISINKGKDCYVHMAGIADGEYLSGLDGEWAGPLDPPEEEA